MGTQAQKTITAKLVDSTKAEPIPYATIQFNKDNGVISNEKGIFNLNIQRVIAENDSLHISCLGFEPIDIQVLNFNDSIVYMQPKIIDLDQVIITNQNLDIDAIIDSIKLSIPKNYDKSYSKRKLFFRNSYYTYVDKSDIDLKKSSIPEINQHFIDSMMYSLPKNYDNHAELLGDMYGKLEAGSPQKMDMYKATYLYDKKNEITFENYEERFNEIFRKHVKRDSYFKIKSGIFGTKEEIDSSLFGDEEVKKAENQSEAFLKEQEEKEKKRKEGFLKYRKSQIRSAELDNFLSEDNELNFIEKSRKYRFTLEDYDFFNNAFVYKIAFEPKGGADFKGTMYVNTEDFAILRVDYENVKSLRKLSLLGLSYDEFEKSGTIIFQQNESEKYSLKYMDETTGQKVGIKRPLKIIEKNKNVKGRRKQNEVSCKIHFIVRNVEKRELIVFETNSLNQSEFEAFEENPNVLPTYLSAYDPSFWEGYNIIEPNEAIKTWKKIEDSPTETE
jgi:hypothetical protein